MMEMLNAVLPYLDRGDASRSKWPDAKGEYWALCPFHNDTHADNFSVSERGYKCFACGAKGSVRKLAEHLGAREKNPRHHRTEQRDRGLTLAQYSQAKRLPQDFLRELDVDETEGRYGPYLLIPYRDEAGQTMATRRRFRLSGRKRFAWTKDSRLIPYGLWRLFEMRKAGWVLLVEGESDCHTAWHHGLPALGTPGANAWKPEWAQYLRGLEVYVWQEPDQGGDALVKTLADSLPHKVLRPPKGIKDLSQAHCQGKDVVLLLEQMKADAKPVSPARSDDEAVDALTRTPETLQKDYGHADRLSTHFRGCYRWATHLGTWMEWQDQVWRPVPKERVAKVAADRLTGDYARQLASAERSEVDRLLRAFREACTYKCIDDALRFLKGSEGFITMPEQWDSKQWVLNVANGLLDLRTGQLRPHSPDDLCTKLAPVVYDPTAKGEVWQAHLDRFLPDKELQRQLQRDLGLSLVGETLEESLGVWYGTGANGKTTTARILQGLLGDYAKRAAPSLLIAGSNERHPTEVADLCGSRLVLSVEVDEGKRLAEALVKELTGGDRKKARLMRQDFFEFEQTFSIVLIVNHKPIITGTDEGIWRRVRLVPWQHRIPKAERRPQDEVLADLMEDGSGILNWLLAGLADWQYDHHWVAEAVQAATDAYRSEQDLLGEFLGEACELGPRYRISVGDLYETYATWCRSTGEEALGKRKFGDLLRQRGIQSGKADKGVRVYLGIRLGQPDTGQVAQGGSGSGSTYKSRLSLVEPEHAPPNATYSRQSSQAEDEHDYPVLAEERSL